MWGVGGVDEEVRGVGGEGVWGFEGDGDDVEESNVLDVGRGAEEGDEWAGDGGEGGGGGEVCVEAGDGDDDLESVRDIVCRVGVMISWGVNTALFRLCSNGMQLRRRSSRSASVAADDTFPFLPRTPSSPLSSE